MHGEPPHTSIPPDAPLLRGTSEHSSTSGETQTVEARGVSVTPLCVLMHLRAPDRSEHTPATAKHYTLRISPLASGATPHTTQAPRRPFLLSSRRVCMSHVSILSHISLMRFSNTSNPTPTPRPPPQCRAPLQPPPPTRALSHSPAPPVATAPQHPVQRGHPQNDCWCFFPLWSANVMEW